MDFLSEPIRENGETRRTWGLRVTLYMFDDDPTWYRDYSMRDPDWWVELMSCVERRYFEEMMLEGTSI